MSGSGEPGSIAASKGNVRTVCPISSAISNTHSRRFEALQVAPGEEIARRFRRLIVQGSGRVGLRVGGRSLLAPSWSLGRLEPMGRTIQAQAGRAMIGAGRS